MTEKLSHAPRELLDREQIEKVRKYLGRPEWSELDDYPWEDIRALCDMALSALSEIREPESGDPFNCPKCGAHDYGLFAASLIGCPHCNLRELEQYKDGFTVMLAAGLQNGFFKPGEQMTHRVIEWLRAVPMRDGVTVESALDAALNASKEKA